MAQDMKQADRMKKARKKLKKAMKLLDHGDLAGIKQPYLECLDCECRKLKKTELQTRRGLCNPSTGVGCG